MKEIIQQWSSLVDDQGKVPRETILAIEQAMFDNKVPNCELLDHSEVCPVKHYFSEGMYAREMFIPAGIAVVGKIHKKRHLTIISKGDISVLTEDGVKRLTGPITFESQPGAKRVVFTHEDTTWTTLHPTEIKDIEKIEKSLVAETYEEFDSYMKQIGE